MSDSLRPPCPAGAPCWGAAAVVPQTVGHVLDERLTSATVPSGRVWIARPQRGVRGEPHVDASTQHPHELDVRYFCASTDVVALAAHSPLQYAFDAAAVIFHMQPVTPVHSVAVDRERSSLQRVHERERDELLGKLQRPVVVGAVARRYGHAERAMVGADEMIACGLARRIR